MSLSPLKTCIIICELMNQGKSNEDRERVYKIERWRLFHAHSKRFIQSFHEG